MRSSVLFFLVLIGLLTAAGADPALDDLAKRQCRSVHLSYQTPSAKAAYVEVTVEKSAPGTYFCALGFDMGYFGIQELANGEKIAIFSVWEKGDDRVELVAKGPQVIDQRFGGEGTGGQSRLPFQWEVGKPSKFLVQSKVDGVFTEFTGHLFDPKTEKWRLMATFKTRSGGIPLRGIYSFVEDFRRDYGSAGKTRRAVYSDGWTLDSAGKWSPITTAKFTADETPSLNVDAGSVGSGFFLQTGGDTVNEGTKLWGALERKSETGSPEGIDSVLIR